MLTVGRTQVPAYVGEEYIEREGKFYHDWENYRAVINGRQVNVVAVAKPWDGDLRVYYDSSVCNPCDQYSRKVGLTLALRRALAFAEHGVPRGPLGDGRLVGEFRLPMLHGKALRDACRATIEKLEVVTLGRPNREA